MFAGNVGAGMKLWMCSLTVAVGFGCALIPSLPMAADNGPSLEEMQRRAVQQEQSESSFDGLRMANEEKLEDTLQWLGCNLLASLSCPPSGE